MSTFSFNLDSIEEVSDHSDTDDDIYGFNVDTRYCGNMIDYDIFYYNYDNNIPMTDTEFYNYITSCIEQRYNGFRNIVFKIYAGNKIRFISVTADKIRYFMQSHNLTFYQALRYIIDKMIECNYTEIYQHYDDSIISNDDGNNYSIADYILSNKYFAIAHVRSLAGSGIVRYSTLSNVIIKDPPSIYGTGNCLFDCISYIIGISFSNTTDLRTKLRYKDGRPIKLKHLDIIAKSIGYKIRVYEDRKINGSLVSYTTTNASDKIISLVLNNKHYSIYDGIKVPISQPIATIRCTIFYDLETYFNKDTHDIEPYCMSYYVLGNGTNNYGCIIKTSYNDNIRTSIYNFFEKYVDTGARLVGYNNGAFDDYILLDIMCKRLDRLDDITIDRYNRILSFTMGSIRSSDLFRITNTSLYKASVSFNCDIIKDPKLSIDHHMIQSYVDNDKFDEYMTSNTDIIRTYAINDVMCLKDLYYKILEILGNISNVRVDTCLTIAQLSMKSFKRYLKSAYTTANIKLPILSNDDDTLVRQALIGARCDTFNIGEYHNIQMIDVCSMYPYIMINRFYPHMLIPKKSRKSQLAQLTRTHKFIDNIPGIYYITILEQPHDNIVPFTASNGSKHDWHYKGTITRWVSYISVNMLALYKCKYIIHEGYVMRCDMGDIFKGYLLPIINLKKDQDMYKSTDDTRHNPALRECLKLIANSLSGKMCERPITIDKILTNNTAKCNDMISKYYDNISSTLIHDNLWLLEGTILKPKIKSPTIIGIMILDYAKQYMYDNIISKIPNKYYMDTDSVILSTSDISRIPTNMFGNEQGMFKYVLPEYDGPYHCIIASKKCYCVYTIVNGVETIYKDMFKIKGVNVKTDKYISDSILDDVTSSINANDHIYLNKIYREAPSAMSINLMRHISTHNIAHILCYQIQRTLSSAPITNNLSLSNRYIIKRIPYDIDESV